MVPTLFFYQLVLVALVWLCLLLQWVLPSDRVRYGLCEAVAALDASQGRWADRPCLDVERSAALSGATVAADADGLSNGAGGGAGSAEERGVERLTCV